MRLLRDSETCIREIAVLPSRAATRPAWAGRVVGGGVVFSRVLRVECC